MESASPSENPPEPPSSRFSHFVGTVIAFLTLMLPLLAIANFSMADPPPATLPSYPVSRSDD
ncbi:MAG: hypothetical protein AAGD09_07745 [Cyanobacteria bacterium P01_F01_bin.56]